jgi:3-oxoacyl-[acyl-carrier protein] reductase
MLNLIQNAKAIVTGASGSIGAAIATLLHSMGAHVVLSGTNEEKLSALGNTLKERYSIAICDLQDQQACLNLVSQVPDLSILVCNAGITEDGLGMRMSTESFKKVLDVNLTSTFILNREALKVMFKAKYGRVINISSVVALAGNKGQSNYCASKAGLIGMTKSLAREVAQRGITVNTVAPGFIVSNMTKDLPDKYRQAAIEEIPQGRFGTPEDVAHAVAYLASEQAGYVTGHTLHINGGMLMV